MIIVSGRIYVHPGSRESFLKATAEAVAAVRRSPGCSDFVVAGDPLESDRVNVYEEWVSETELLAFRGQGPSQDLRSSIVRAQIARHIVSSTGPA